MSIYTYIQKTENRPFQLFQAPHCESGVSSRVWGGDVLEGLGPEDEQGRQHQVGAGSRWWSFVE
eukprot:4609352-Amphidinium_carterae.1